MLLAVAAILSLAQVVTAISLIDAAAQDRAYCSWDSSPDVGWIVIYLGSALVAAGCLATSASFLARGDIGTSRIILYAAVAPVLLRSCYGWSSVLVVPSDGCEGDGGYIVPDGYLLGGAEAPIEIIALVGGHVILAIAIGWHWLRRRATP